MAVVVWHIICHILHSITIEMVDQQVAMLVIVIMEIMVEIYLYIQQLVGLKQLVELEILEVALMVHSDKAVMVHQ